jgi:hypothetical protein
MAVVGEEKKGMTAVVIDEEGKGRIAVAIDEEGPLRILAVILSFLSISLILLSSNPFSAGRRALLIRANLYRGCRRPL